MQSTPTGPIGGDAEPFAPEPFQKAIRVWTEVRWISSRLHPPCLNCEVDAARTVPVISILLFGSMGEAMRVAARISRLANTPHPKGVACHKSHAQLCCGPL
jgi:hypothetical protein